jgi:DNA-binding beta-propeller fold protein YncE
MSIRKVLPFVVPAVVFGVSIMLAAATPRQEGGGGASNRPAGYHVVKKVNLGGEGFWDYLTADPGAHRLYISRGDHVVVVDTRTDKPVGEIPAHGVHGIALDRRGARGFISNGRSGTVTIFDRRTLKVISEVNVNGKNPDCIIFDPVTRRAFTFNGGSDSASAISAAGKLDGTIDLNGRPEYAQPDGRGHIFNNLEDKSQLLEIDARSLSIMHRWDLAPCESPSGMAMDSAHHRVFIGCHNKMMAIVNADTGKVVATVPIGEGVDANRFDPGTQLAFSSNGRSGTLTVVHEDSPDKYTELGNVSTQMGARTMALDRRTHTVYLVTAEFGPRPAPTPEHPHPYPSVVPGSFTLIVVGR